MNVHPWANSSYVSRVQFRFTSCAITDAGFDRSLIKCSGRSGAEARKIICDATKRANVTHRAGNRVGSSGGRVIRRPFIGVRAIGMKADLARAVSPCYNGVTTSARSSSLFTARLRPKNSIRADRSRKLAPVNESFTMNERARLRFTHGLRRYAPFVGYLVRAHTADKSKRRGCVSTDEFRRDESRVHFLMARASHPSFLLPRRRRQRRRLWCTCRADD